MEQELLQQILSEIKGVKSDINKLDKKIDRVERRLIDEINLQVRYVLEDVEMVSDKLKRVIDKNKLIV